jgi:hypothetical protein
MKLESPSRKARRRTMKPTKEEFEAELDKVLKIADRKDQYLFLACVGTVAITGFLCACLLWVVLP